MKEKKNTYFCIEINQNKSKLFPSFEGRQREMADDEDEERMREKEQEGEGEEGVSLSHSHALSSNSLLHAKDNLKVSLSHTLLLCCLSPRKFDFDSLIRSLWLENP